MKRTFVLLLITSLAGLTAKLAAETPEKLIAEIIESPGDFDQMCSAGPGLDPALPLPAYDRVMRRSFHLSEKSLARLAARRDEVVPALAKKIVAMEPGGPEAKKTPPAARNYTTMAELASHSGVSPRQVSGLLLEIVEGLNAIEVLPELLALEDRFDQALEHAEKNPALSPPAFDHDGVFFFKGQKAPLAPRQEILIKGRVLQRELLATMLHMLRTQRFQPLLDSEFEHVYATALRKRAGKEDLRLIKTPADAQEKKMMWLRFDPIYHLPVGDFDRTPSVPYTAAARTEARRLVAAFIATMPRPS